MTYYIGEVSGVTPITECFGEPLTKELSYEFREKFTRVLLDLLSSEGWERAGWEYLRRITDGDLHALCEFNPDILDLSHHDVVVLFQISGLWRKLELEEDDDKDRAVLRRAAAKEKFLATEQSCKRINGMFRDLRWGRAKAPSHANAILHRARRKIAKTLGDLPSLLDWRPRFGPGASVSVPKKNACLAVKLKGAVTCSRNIVDIFDRLTENLGSIPVPAEARVDFVPKTFLVDRVIAVEPMLNGFWQLAFGRLIEERLLRVGIDVRDQTKNQRLALYGSISGRWATIDLSAASDTIALELARELLPEEWMVAVETLRSAEGELDGNVFQFEKVSSAGNGFTFPLETLIFWALADSCQDECGVVDFRQTVVFGDDIIINTESVDLLREVFSYLGFSINESKSFWSGSFRESCGKDYLLGKLVRPCFVKDLRGSSLFTIHNFFYDRGEKDIARFVERFIGRSLRRYGPREVGDGVLHADDIVLKPVTSKGYSGFAFESWAYKPRLLAEELRQRYGRQVSLPTQVFDARLGAWRVKPMSYFIWDSSQTSLVRRMVRYALMRASSRSHYLTRTDALRGGSGGEWSSTAGRRGGHVYNDRRMPEAPEKSDTDPLVVPGFETWALTKIYIFGTSRVS